jgi:hypothetical protein
MTQFPMSPPPGPRPSLFPGSSPVPICKCWYRTPQQRECK